MKHERNAPGPKQQASELIELFRKRAAYAAQRASATPPGHLSPEQSIEHAAFLSGATIWTQAADDLENSEPPVSESEVVHALEALPVRQRLRVALGALAELAAAADVTIGELAQDPMLALRVK